MKSNINIIPLKTWSKIPSSWESRPNTINYNLHPESELYADGWRDVVVPSIDQDTQKLGVLVYDSINDIVTYQVIDLTPEEISQREKALVPYSITPTQGRIQLSRMGLLEGVEAMVSGSTDKGLIIYWEYALSWDIDNKHINSMALVLGMSEADIDQFFIDASLIS